MRPCRGFEGVVFWVWVSSANQALARPGGDLWTSSGQAVSVEVGWGEWWGLIILDVNEICRPGSDAGSGHFEGPWLVYLAEAKNVSKLWKLCSQAVSFCRPGTSAAEEQTNLDQVCLCLCSFLSDANMNNLIT